MYHHLNKQLPMNGLRRRNVSGGSKSNRAPLKFTRSSSSGSTSSSSSRSWSSSSSSTAPTKRSACTVDLFRHRYFCTIGIIKNTPPSLSTSGNTTASCRRNVALRRMGIQQLSTRLLLRNTPRIHVPLRCTNNATAESSSVAAASLSATGDAWSNTKEVKAEENEDTMTHYHDDKKKLEQQQRKLSNKKKACTNTYYVSTVTDVAGTILTAAVNMNKKAKKVTMKSTEKKASNCSVNFNETVTVIPIPTKDEYSNRIKSKLWTSKYEMMERIVRNELEFATEGYDWRLVCTEEEMYIYYINNDNVEDDSAATIRGGTAASKSYELIHPVHFDLGEYTFGMGGQIIKLSSDRLYNC